MATARVALFEHITNDPEMNSIGFTRDNVWNANAADSPQRIPFIVIVWGIQNTLIGTRGPELVKIWVHQKPYSYDVIDSAIQRIDELLLNAVHVIGSDGSILTQADPQGISEDFFDDAYGTLTKNTSWSILSRRT